MKSGARISASEFSEFISQKRKQLRATFDAVDDKRDGYLDVEVCELLIYEHNYMNFYIYNSIFILFACTLFAGGQTFDGEAECEPRRCKLTKVVFENGPQS